MIANGECRESQRTGTRTRTAYECGGENRDNTDAARESVHRMQNQGAMCGGDNVACSTGPE